MLLVDGKQVAWKPGAKLRLDRPPRTVVLEFGPAANRTRAPARDRFMLDGYAITDLAINSQSSTGAPPAVSLHEAFASSGRPAASAPAGWMRDGLRPSMAKVFETASAHGGRGLAIVDDDPSGHAEWHTIKELATPVTPGDSLVLEWNEVHSLGRAGAVSVQYVDLPAGYYRFRLNELSVMGEPSELETSLAFEVPLAFWRTPWFWISMASLALAAVAGAWRYAVWQRLQRRLLRLEEQRAVDRERLRIAQDIHDDLGARVTQISLLSICIQDDGCGFDPTANLQGHGLGNLKRRMQEISGDFAIESRKAVGTTVSLHLPVPEGASGAA